jgi:hypothetical protein
MIPLANRRKPEQCERDVEIPLRQRRSARQPAVGLQVLGFSGNASRPFPVAERAEILRTRAEQQRVVREVHEWMPDGGQLPIDDGGNTRLR